jgi:hypothetical protein
MATRRLFDGATIEIGQVPITSPTFAGNQMWINIAGTDRQAITWLNVGGVWKQTNPQTNVSGTWR